MINTSPLDVWLHTAAMLMLLCSCVFPAGCHSQQSHLQPEKTASQGTGTTVEEQSKQCSQTVIIIDKSSDPVTANTFNVIENQFGMRFLGIPEPNVRRAENQPSNVLYIQDREVTCEQFARVRIATKHPQANPLPTEGLALMHVYPNDFDSAWDAIQFASELSEFDAEYNYRLPTESEWERACLAGSDTPPPRQLKSSLFKSLQVERDDTVYTLIAQGRIKMVPNAYGLYNMLGGLGEYCSDVFDSQDAGESQKPPTRLTRRVVRGTYDKGGWDFSDRRAGTGGSTPTMKYGLRLVLEPEYVKQ